MDLKIKWSIEKRNVADLKLWTRNPRKITEAQYEALKKRIVERGMHDVIKIDIDGTILSGNQRKRALKDLGIEEVVCLIPERALTDQEKEDIAIESNLSSGEWDFDILANEFETENLLSLGFSKAQLGLMRGDKHLTKGEDTFENTNSQDKQGIKKIVLYFGEEEYIKIHDRIKALMGVDQTLESEKDVFMRALETYESSQTSEQEENTGT